MLDRYNSLLDICTMSTSGHTVFRTEVKKNSALLCDKYQCSYCNHLLKDAVQAECGHWLCECCAVQLLAESLPKCPKVDCQELFKSDKELEGAEFFPDRFVRREIEKMIVSCPHQQKGCQWKDRRTKLETHLKNCDFLCGVVLTPDQIGSHGRVCSKALMKCPLAVFGCRHTQTMTQEELNQHVNDHGLEHLQSLADVLKLFLPICPDEIILKYMCTVEEEQLRKGFSPEQDYTPHIKVGQRERDRYGDSSSIKRLSDERELKDIAQKKVAAEAENQLETIAWEKSEERSSAEKKLEEKKPAKLEKNMDDDWKIPQFSQKKTVAQSDKCQPMFSTPFYTRPCYGYNMCLKLLILREGILLSFVIMKGDFDHIVQWPFTSKVTFKLINQTGGRDIKESFQPDPDLMSASLQKPKEDMNIANRCTLFVQHSELDTDGFIVNDTICINCCVSPPPPLNNITDEFVSIFI